MISFQSFLVLLTFWRYWKAKLALTILVVWLLISPPPRIDFARLVPRWSWSLQLMDEMKELQLESHQASPLCCSFWMVLVQKMDHLYPFVHLLFGDFGACSGHLLNCWDIGPSRDPMPLWLQELCLKMWTQVKFAANLSVKKWGQVVLWCEVSRQIRWLFDLASTGPTTMLSRQWLLWE